MHQQEGFGTDLPIETMAEIELVPTMHLMFKWLELEREPMVA